MSTSSRWMNWKPKARILADSAESEPSKPTEPDSASSLFCNSPGLPPTKPTEPLEAVLKGRVIELWSDALGERFWLVADEQDAVLLGEPRCTIYTATEARRIVQIADPDLVAELLRYRRTFDAKLSEIQGRQAKP